MISNRKNQLLYKLIPYRMQAVDTLNFALKLRSNWSAPPPMTMHINGKQIMEGNLNAFTNPAIEAGLIHCRALLEFLGLNERNGQLRQRGSRQTDDIGIEHFSNNDGPLKKLGLEDVFKKYEGDHDEARDAILTVFYLTNKGLAHITDSRIAHPESDKLIEIASRGIPSLLISYLYTPLKIPAPEYKIRSRLKDD